MKRVLSILISIALVLSCVMISFAVMAKEPEFSLDAIDFIKNFKAGWNLGNTFEATGRWGESWSDSYTVNDVETGWGNPTTTQEMFDKVAEQGFNAVRIPISWYRWTDDNNGYKIDDKFMARIKEVVGYAYNNNLYTIINMHHDDKDWLNIGANDEEWAKILEKYNAIWTQIANEFKDYDEYLLFESANEMVNGSNWWGSDADLARVNDIHKNFVNTVRATGGNNEKRYLMLPTLGAQWYEHQWGALKIPNNDKHCIIDIHWYSTKQADFNTYMSAINRGLISKGIPAVFGECGINKNSSASAKESWAKAYFGTAAYYGIPTFIWDDGGDFQVLNRRTLNRVTQSQVYGIISAAENAEPYVPTTAPTTAAPTTKPPTTYDPSIPVIKKTFYNFKPTNKGDTFKTEGWVASESYWGPTADLTVACQKDGSVIYSTAASKTDFYNQINTDWKNIPSIQGKEVFMDFTNNTNLPVKVKLHYNDANTNVIPAGETKTLSIIAISDKNVLNIMIQSNGGTLHVGSNQYQISALYTLEPDLTATTAAPTTKAPTTAAPTTKAPTTVAPTTKAPTTAAPTTKAPTTVAPTTKTPTTIASTTNAPTTVAPTTVEPVIVYGDLNSDKNVNLLDLILLRKYLAKWNITVDMSAADCNADGNVNPLDLILLRKYLAKWNVILG